MQMILT